MGDGKHVSFRVQLRNRVEGPECSFLHMSVVLPARGATSRFQIARVVALDLDAGQSLPVAGMALHQLLVEDNRPNSDLLGDDRGRGGGPLERGGEYRLDAADCPGGLARLRPSEIREGRIFLSLPPSSRVPLGLSVSYQEEPCHRPQATGHRISAGTEHGCWESAGPAAAVWSEGSRERGEGYPRPVPVVLLFAQAREAAGVSSVDVRGQTVAEVVEDLSSRFGPSMADVVAVSRIWCNGEPVEPTASVGEGDEIAVLPPVSGG